MRCADFGPMPGSRPSSSMSAWTGGAYVLATSVVARHEVRARKGADDAVEVRGNRARRILHKFAGIDVFIGWLGCIDARSGGCRNGITFDDHFRWSANSSAQRSFNIALILRRFVGVHLRRKRKHQRAVAYSLGLRNHEKRFGHSLQPRANHALERCRKIGGTSRRRRRDGCGCPRRGRLVRRTCGGGPSRCSRRGIRWNND